MFPYRSTTLTFSEETDGTSVVTFLNGFEEKKQSLWLTDDRLLACAVDLFSGPALVWYKSIRREVHSWGDLVSKIRQCFLTTHFELSLWDEIRARKQGRSETCIFYIAHMRELFGRFSHTPPTSDQLHYG